MFRVDFVRAYNISVLDVFLHVKYDIIRYDVTDFNLWTFLYHLCVNLFTNPP